MQQEELEKILENALKTGETSNIEFKANYSTWKDKHQEKDKDILSMANCLDNEDDCYIFIGIKDDRTLIGLEENKVRKECHFEEYKKSKHMSEILDIHLYNLVYKSKHIDIIHIKNRVKKPYYKKSGKEPHIGRYFYIRNGKSSRNADDKEIEELYEYKSNRGSEYEFLFRADDFVDNSYILKKEKHKLEYKKNGRTLKMKIYNDQNYEITPLLNAKIDPETSDFSMEAQITFSGKIIFYY